jgi:hypothetical protein
VLQAKMPDLMSVVLHMWEQQQQRQQQRRVPMLTTTLQDGHSGYL